MSSFARRLRVKRSGSHQRTAARDEFKPSGFVVSDVTMVLLVVLAVVGVVQDRPLLAMLGALVLVIALLSRMWARIALSQMSYRCETSTDRAVQGDELVLSLTIENHKPVPVPWVLIREQIPAGLQILDGQPTQVGLFRTSLLATTTSIGAHQRVRLQFRLKALQRGHYVFGPGRLTSGDPFGFYESERTMLRAMHTLIVYPSMSPLPAASVELARPIGDALVRARAVEDPSVPVAVREYVAGDSIRAIDWKVTARRAAPWVRVNASSVTGMVVLLLECDTRRHGVWDDSPQLLERIVHTAASVARHLLATGQAVGLVANGVPANDHARVALAPAAGREQLIVLLDAIARVQGIIVKPLPRLVREQSPHVIPYGASVVGISAVSTDAMTQLLLERRVQGAPVVHIHVGDDDPSLDEFSPGGPSPDRSSSADTDPKQPVQRITCLHWPNLETAPGVGGFAQ